MRSIWRYSPSMPSPQMHVLHRLDVVVAPIVRCGDLSFFEGLGEVTDSVLDVVARREAEFPLQLRRGDAVGTRIVGGGALDPNARPDDLANLFGDFDHFQVVAADIVGLAINGLAGPCQRLDIEIGHVLDMEVRPLLLAAEDRDGAARDGVHRQDVDGKIEAQPRRPATNRGGPYNQRLEPGYALLAQDLLALGLVLGVVGERLQRQVLGDVRLLLDAVDTGRRGVDEPPHSRTLRGLDQRPKRIEVDALAKRGVEFKARVVRDAGEMDHRVAAG